MRRFDVLESLIRIAEALAISVQNFLFSARAESTKNVTITFSVFSVIDVSKGAKKKDKNDH